MTDPQIQQLIEAAIDASRHAYAPYSHYLVGAALLASDGAVYGGCNIESAAYSPTLCAERTALAKAVSEGQRAFAAIAVVTRDGGSPCGVCRQMLYEFAPHLRVVIADFGGQVRFDGSLATLLPFGFNADSLRE